VSEIDWQADLEKKVENLLRRFDAEVRSHGDEAIVRVTVEVVPVGKSAKRVDDEADRASPVPTKRKSKKKVNTDAAESAGDVTGDD